MQQQSVQFSQRRNKSRLNRAEVCSSHSLTEEENTAALYRIHVNHGYLISRPDHHQTNRRFLLPTFHFLKSRFASLQRRHRSTPAHQRSNRPPDQPRQSPTRVRVYQLLCLHASSVIVQSRRRSWSHHQSPRPPPRPPPNQSQVSPSDLSLLEITVRISSASTSINPSSPALESTAGPTSTKSNEGSCLSAFVSTRKFCHRPVSPTVMVTSSVAPTTASTTTKPIAGFSFRPFTKSRFASLQRRHRSTPAHQRSNRPPDQPRQSPTRVRVYQLLCLHASSVIVQSRRRSWSHHQSPRPA